MTLNWNRLAAASRHVGFFAGMCVLLLTGRAAFATYEDEVLIDTPLSWWRFDEPSLSTSFADSGTVGLALEDPNLGAGVVSGIPNGFLPQLGSAINTTNGRVEAFDDTKGGQLALDSNFTYETWQFFTADEAASFTGLVGGNSVNTGAGTGTDNFYGTRMLSGSGLGGPGGNIFRRLMSAGWTGTELFGFEFPTDTPTKDLHFPLGDTGADPIPDSEGAEFSPENGQWYYTTVRFKETAPGGNSSTQLAGDVYWLDPNGTVQHRKREHGVEITPTRTPVSGSLGFAVGGELGTGLLSFPGNIDEFAVYDTALSDERIEAHFMAGIVGAVLPDPADFNRNGLVGGGDFLIWQRNFPTPTGATMMDGDADGDGDVDDGDLLIWEGAFGSSISPLSAATAAVPEPTSFVLFAFGVLALASAKRRR